MNVEGPKIPQGLILLFIGTDSPTPLPSRRRNGSNFTSADRHGALVPLPDSYEAAAKLALQFFGAQLSITEVEDIVLKLTIKSPTSPLTTVYAEFDAENWSRVMVGSDIEVGVFKVQKADANRDKESDCDESFYGAMPPIASPPAAHWATYSNPSNNPWLTNNNGVIPWNNNFNTSKDRTIQITCVSKCSPLDANIPVMPPTEGPKPTHSWESALVCLPESYEACERVSRETFDPPAGSKMTMRVMNSPSAMIMDYVSLTNWTKVHPSAYATAVVGYSGALELRIDFSGVEQVEDAKNSNAGARAKSTGSDDWVEF